MMRSSLLAAALILPAYSHLGTTTGSTALRRIAQSVQMPSESWFDKIAEGIGETSSGFIRRKPSTTDLAQYVMVPEEDEREAVTARRRCRITAGRTWTYEPQAESDPGISWEHIGLVREIKLFPVVCVEPSRTVNAGADDIDTRSHGGHSPTAVHASGVVPSCKVSKRLTAMIRLK
ncbi:hypothetical protein T492DRAFT_936811 [Pavlovales sp. CCMP2436]|nr:hypothetical protein T492DRAFT_936811 [Pavlovales sp. CCMP2436]